MTIDELRKKLDETSYVYDDNMLTILYVALTLGRPLLIEGAAGVGKTEVAKVMAQALGRDLVRLQCYEGLDESKALYEWNYQKQLLAIQVDRGREEKETLTRSLFSDEYLLERPLLKSIRSEAPVVLLIDEIDKADEDFAAFLLVLLISIVAAGVSAALLGLLVGVPALRLKGDYLAIITLGFGMIIVNVINNLPFCGQQGLSQGSASSALYASGLGFSNDEKMQYL